MKLRPFFLLYCLSVCTLSASGPVLGATLPDQGTKPVQSRPVWISVSPGARPAYVGIQGGTAPLTLSACADGSIIAFTGASGNDFTKILHKNPPPPEVVHPVTAEEPAATLAQAGFGVPAQPLLPIGLDKQEDLMLAEIPAPVRHVEKIPFKPLRLGSYKRVLRSSGSV